MLPILRTRMIAYTLAMTASPLQFGVWLMAFWFTTNGPAAYLTCTSMLADPMTACTTEVFGIIPVTVNLCHTLTTSSHRRPQGCPGHGRNASRISSMRRSVCASSLLAGSSAPAKSMTTSSALTSARSDASRAPASRIGAMAPATRSSDRDGFSVADIIPDFSDHMALVLSAVGALYVAIRLYVISGGSTETYSIILETQGTGSVLVSAILEVVPTVPLFFVSGWVGWRLWSNGRMVKLDWYALAFALALALVLSSLLLVGFVLFLICLLAFFVLRDLQNKDARKKFQSEAAGIREDEGGLKKLPDPEGEKERERLLEWEKGLSREETLAAKLMLSEAEEFVERFQAEVDDILGRLEGGAPRKVLGLVARIDELIKEAANQKEHPPLLSIATKQVEILRRLRRTAARAEQFLKESASQLIVMWGTAIVSFVVAFAVIADPWIPRERVDVPGKSVVGFVLAEDSDEVTILRDKPRDVLRIGPVTKRTYCLSHVVDLPKGVRRLLAEPLLVPNRGGSYPDC